MSWSKQREEQPDGFARGDYLRSDSELFCIEEIADGYALLEECRTGRLIDVPVATLYALSMVKRGSAR
jgi:hypothetical protein